MWLPEARLEQFIFAGTRRTARSHTNDMTAPSGEGKERPGNDTGHEVPMSEDDHADS